MSPCTQVGHRKLWQNVPCFLTDGRIVFCHRNRSLECKVRPRSTEFFLFLKGKFSGWAGSSETVPPAQARTCMRACVSHVVGTLHNLPKEWRLWEKDTTDDWKACSGVFVPHPADCPAQGSPASQRKWHHHNVSLVFLCFFRADFDRQGGKLEGVWSLRFYTSAVLSLIEYPWKQIGKTFQVWSECFPFLLTKFWSEV